MNILLLKSWLNANAAALIGARVAAAEQIDERSFCLHLLHEDGVRYLLVSSLEEFPALALISNPRDVHIHGTAECNFVKALRFHLSGYQLMSIVQPGFERSVSFTFSQRDAYGRTTVKILTAELAGRSSNVFLLTAQRMVVSIFKRVRHGQNRVRHVMTGKLFPDPPPLGKYIASESTSDALADEMSKIALSSSSASVDVIEALLSRQCAGGDTKLWPALAQMVPVQYELRSLFDFILAFQRGEYTADLFGLGPHRSSNTAIIESWLDARGRRGLAPRPVTDAATKVASRIDQLIAQRELALKADELEQEALALLVKAEELDSIGKSGSYIHAWSAAHPDWSAQVSPERSAYDNAQELIHYAQRLRRGLGKLEDSITSAQAELERLEHATPQTDKPAVKSKPDPSASAIARLSKFDLKYLRFTSGDGIPILCGVSDRSNDGLLRAFGSARHLWFHARDYPGSHVFLLCAGQDVPQRSIEQAAIVAAFHSQGRGETDLSVSYLPANHLRRPKDGKPGQVLKTSEKVINVRPANFDLIRDEIHYKPG